MLLKKKGSGPRELPENIRQIPLVKHMRYLGVEFEEDGNFKLEAKLKK